MEYEECMQKDRLIMLRLLKDYTGVYSNYLRHSQICSILSSLAQSGIMALHDRQSYGERIIDIVDDTGQKDSNKVLQLERLLAEMTKRKNDLELLLNSRADVNSLQVPLDELKNQINRLQDMIPAHKDITEEIQRAVTSALDNYRRDTVEPLMERFIKRNEEFAVKLKSLTDGLAIASETESRTGNLIEHMNNLARLIQDQPGAFQIELDKFIKYLDDFKNSLNNLRSKVPSVSDEIDALKRENDELKSQMENMRDLKDYSDLENKVSELQETIRKHQEVEDELKRKLEEEENEHEKSRREITSKREDITNDCERRLLDEQAKIVDLEDQLKRLKERCAIAEHVEDIDDRAKELEKELEEKKQQIDTLKEKISELEQKSKDIRVSKDIDQDKLSKLQTDYDQKVNELDEKEQRLNDMNLRHQALEEDIDQKKNQIDELQRKIDELEDKLKNLPPEISRRSKSLDQNKLDQLQEECDRRIKDLEDKEEKLKQSDDRIQQLSSELEEKQNQITTLQNRITELEGTTTNLEDQKLIQDKLDKLQADYDQKVSELEEKEEKIRSLRVMEERLVEQEKDITELHQQIGNLENQLNSLLSKNAKGDKLSKGKFDKLQEEYDRKVQELEDLKDCKSRVQELEKELDQRRNEIDTLDQQVQTSIQTSKSKSMSDARRRELEEKENKLEQLQIDYDSKVKELEDLDNQRSQVKTLQQRIDDLENELEQKRTEIESLQRKVDTLDQQVQTSKSKSMSDARRRELEEKENKLEQLQIGYNSKLQELEDLDNQRNQVKTLQQRIDELEDQLKNVPSSDRIRELEVGIAERERRLEQLQGDYDKKVQELEANDITQYQREIEDKKNQIDSLERTISELEAKLEQSPTVDRLRELEDSLREKESRLEKLQNDFDKSLEELKICEDKLTSGTDSEDVLNSKIRDLQVELDNCLSKQKEIIADYDEKIANLERNVDEAKSAREELEKGFEKEKQDIISKYQDEIDEYKKTIEEKENFIKMLQKEIEEKGDVSANAIALQEKVNSLERKMEALEKALEECNKENRDKSKELEEKNEEIQKLLEQINDYESIMAGNKEALRMIDERIAELDRVNAENEELKKTMEQLNEDISKLRNTSEDANNYKVLLNEARDKISNLEREYDDERKAKLNEIEELKNKNKELEVRSSQAEKQLEALQSEVSNLNGDKDKTIEELRNIIKEKDTLLGEKEKECLERIRQEIAKIKKSYSIEREVLPAVVIDDCNRIRKELPRITEEIKSRSQLLNYHITGISEKVKKPIKNAYIRSMVTQRMPMVDQTREDLLDFEANREDLLTMDDCTKIVPYGQKYEKLLADLDVRGPDIADLYELLSGIGKTLIRIKPKDPQNDSSTKLVEKISEVEIRYCFKDKKGNKVPPFGPFDKIFTEDYKTDQLFKEVVPALDNLNGENTYNIVFLAYGQSGSGKTFTLLGERNKNNVFTKGLFSYVCSYLKVSDFVKDINVRMYQLYRGAYYDIYTTQPGKVIENEESFDLTNKSNSIDRMTSKNISYFADTSMIDYFSVRRFQRKTPLNKNSSRSHAFIELIVSLRNGNESLIAFCDLGGSEDLRVYPEGAVARPEGEYIVKSLLDLGDILTSFAAGKGKFKGGGIYSGNALRNALNRYLDLDREKSETVLNRFYLFITVRGYTPQKDEKAIEISKATTLGTLTFSDKLRSQNL
jgi:chromosome segregation ATPase